MAIFHEFLSLSFHQHVENNTPEDKTCRQVAKRKSVEETWSKKGEPVANAKKVCGLHQQTRRNLQCMYVRANWNVECHISIIPAAECKQSTVNL
jgi:hypothetical protein